MATIAVLNGTSRTANYLIPKALDDGLGVRAVVRSRARFESKIKKHDNLSAYELADFNDVQTLSKILQGVDVLFIAASSVGNEPTTLLQDIVQTCVAAIRTSCTEGKANIRIVLLSAAPVSPTISYSGPATEHSTPAPMFVRFLRHYAINHHYDDLENAQNYLRRQSAWLGWTVVTPGMIVDVVESPNVDMDWKLSTTELPEGSDAITYSRLAAAMLALARGETYLHAFVTPLPTSKVPVRLTDMKFNLTTMASGFASEVVLPGLIGALKLTLGIGIGIMLQRARWRPGFGNI
jgi:nucleoside-diphosphate-sugar epimerase